jgi:hypothetical protein
LISNNRFQVSISVNEDQVMLVMIQLSNIVLSIPLQVQMNVFKLSSNISTIHVNLFVSDMICQLSGVEPVKYTTGGVISEYDTIKSCDGTKSL